ncbi:excalibur calcium-binding domain-containing protein [Marinobacter sp.]|uniref:excalibur calcium-binding domain-containing protein n=1 Tax=Marinobacter sp. TaxID=50741 RepID=UPI003A92E9C0
MKNLILTALIAFGAWQFYQSKQPKSQPTPVANPMAGQKALIEEAKRVTSFHCDGRQHCSQMNSRAEAEFFTRNCPDTKMDGDRDGIPCENDSRF